MIERIRNRLDKRTNLEKLRDRGVKIGRNVDILNTKIDECHGFLVSIGDNVTITGSTILTHDASTKKFIGYSKVGRVDIGNNVFVGYGSIILPNTKIGNNVIVGAGTVVAKDVPDNVVICGNPWKVICTFDEYIKNHRENLKKKPVYNTLWNEKSDQEKEQMFNELENTIGYDL